MLRYRGNFTPIFIMDVSKELDLIDNRNWNKPALKMAAVNIILALKAINDYAKDTGKNISEIAPAELLNNIVQMDYYIM